MTYRTILISLLVFLGACTVEKESSSDYELYLTDDLPIHTPKPFLPLGPLDGLITHQGVFSPDYQSYYFTVSDPGFTQFTVKQISKEDGGWSEPKDAFFNSTFNEHGLSFSQDGNTLFFTSTRPIAAENVAATWHIWRVDRTDGEWGRPTYVDVPNLGHQLMSHPSVAADGTLYFHSSDPDYSKMGIYFSEPAADGQYLPGKRLKIKGLDGTPTCTPYIDPAERFILFALIGEQLELVASKKMPSGEWGPLQKLPAAINTKGQGNPQVSPDGKYLFYAVGDYAIGQGSIQWIDLAAVLLR